MGVARLEFELEELFGDQSRFRARDADYTDTTAASGGGDGGDGVGNDHSDNLFSSGFGVDLFGNNVLLDNRQGVVGNPVKYQTSREP